MKKYTFDDFREICHIGEKDLIADVDVGELYCVIHCFRISHCGAWIIKPNREHSSEDFDHRYKLANGDHSKPFLKFPCSRAQIKKLLTTPELSSRIVVAPVDGEMDDAWVSKFLNEALGEDTPATKVPKGRHPGADLTESVSYLYAEFRKQGNNEILEPGKIQEFISRMKSAIKEGDQNYSDYVAERIESIKKIAGKLNIKTQKGKNYGPNAVSKRLTLLRKENPLM